MSTVIKDLGAVSAYAYAVEKGYTGTEAEFAELMADYAEVGQRAEDAAESALNSKTAAQTAATTATNKASEASQSASAAGNSADQAAQSASQAQTSAQTASSKASEASQSASTASAKASESAQSASQALSYKTDAESAKTASQTAQGLAESARDSAISAKNDAESARDEAQEIVDGISAKSTQIDANTAGIASLTKDKAPVITDTASGAIASFSDGGDNLPLKSLIVEINPIQDGTGDPSPDNVRPISGWTGMQLNANGTVIPISWQTEAGTVYGGSLDVLSGVLTVDKAIVDLATLTWTYQSATGVFYSNGFPQCKNNTTKMMFSNQPWTAKASQGDVIRTDKSICKDSNGRLYVHDTAYSTSENFQTSMSGAMMCYELATPITYNLTPTEVKSLLGVNNVWSDTGDVSVEYRADTKLYIERLTEPDADMIADSNIVSGQYFMVGNSLFKATANIASGASVIVGTNAIRKSLSEALNEINA